MYDDSINFVLTSLHWVYPAFFRGHSVHAPKAASRQVVHSFKALPLDQKVTG